MPNIKKEDVVRRESYKGFTILKGYILSGGDRKLKYEAHSNRKLGARKRKQFDTMEDARDCCTEWKQLLKTRSSEASALTTKQIEDAAIAFGLLEERGMHGVSLEDVAKEWLKTIPTTSDKTVEEMRISYFEHLAEEVREKAMSKRTVQGYRSKLAFLTKEFGNRAVKSVRGIEVWNLLEHMKNNPPKPPKGIKQVEKWSRGSLESYASVWNAFFEYCVVEDQIEQSPLVKPSIKDKIKRKTRKGTTEPPAILSVPEARSILREAWKMRWRRCLPGVVVLHFCGLRPEAEMLKLTWDDIKLGRGKLEVRGHKSKREMSARTLKIPEHAREWLEYSKAILEARINWMVNAIKEMDNGGSSYEQGRMRGKLRKLAGQHLQPILRNGKHIEHWVQDEPLKFAPNKWSSNWGTIRKSAGLKTWKRDTTRHSAASYLWGTIDTDHDGRDKLRAFLGHVDENMFKHYVQAGEDILINAEAYYGSSPKEVLEPKEYELFQRELEGEVGL